MPELPDLTVYIESLERRIVGATLLRIELCQTDGKRLRDRALSRLLHDDWPKSIDELP